MSPSLKVAQRYRPADFFPEDPIRTEVLAVTAVNHSYDYDENRPLTRLYA